MKKKYIIALEDRNVWSYGVPAKTLLLSDVSIFGTDLSSVNTGIELTPYTEPDLDAIRKEAFDEGYQEGMQLSIDDAKLKEAYQKGLADGRNQDAKDFADMYDSGYSEGLKDAWNAARKISSMDSPTRDEVFGLVITSNIFDENTASEAIEKIQQYEQEKEEIKAGDEIKSGNERYIVLQKYLNNIDELMVVLFNRRDGEISVFHLYNGNGAIFEKTGRHFPEIVEVLKKMRKE